MPQSPKSPFYCRMIMKYKDTQEITRVSQFFLSLVSHIGMLQGTHNQLQKVLCIFYSQITLFTDY